MTIVIQHWFDALEVTEEGFSVTLNFGDAPEALKVPYDAIKTFVDPSVEFGLRFESKTRTKTRRRTMMRRNALFSDTEVKKPPKHR